MSWHFSQALVEEYLQVNCLGGEQSSPWSTTPFAPDDSCSDKMKGTCHRSPFGTMFVPSTDALGMAILMFFRRGSLARTSPVPARVLGLMESDPDSTSRWSGSLARFDRAGFRWKTAQTSFITDLNGCSVDLPRWGMMRDGALWELTQPVQPGAVQSSMPYWPDSPVFLQMVQYMLSPWLLAGGVGDGGTRFDRLLGIFAIRHFFDDECVQGFQRGQ